MSYLAKSILYTCIALIIIMQTSCAVDFSSVTSKQCNVQTTLDFNFNSDTTATNSGTLNNAQNSQFKFLDAKGNDLVLTLNKFEIDVSSNAKNFVSAGYNTAGLTISGAFIMKFFYKLNLVYVYIPFTTTSGATSNAHFISKQVSSIGTFAISGSSPAPLTPFNILGETNFNVWFSASSGQTTILASNFIYQIGSAASTGTSLSTQLNSLSFSDMTRLCYASNKNFQTHLRESYPLWFFWISFFIFWLFYLFAESTTLNVYHKNFQNNKWTCWPMYSLCLISHQDFFTRLSRLSVLYINVIIQGLTAGCIMGNIQEGPEMIIWVAVVAFAVTIPFPFLFGEVFFKKIYETNTQKYQSIKNMIGVLDKKQLQPHEQAVEKAQQTIFSYYYCFYTIFFVVFFVCVPITINQMQRLSRVNYHYHYYWIASVFIAFILQHFVYAPLLALLFGNSQLIKNRGGYFYPIKMAEAYRNAQLA